MRVLLLMMMSACLYSAKAQNQFPPGISSRVDECLEKAYSYHEKKDSENTTRYITEVDQKLDSVGKEFSLYKGVIHLFQAYYSFDKRKQEDYRAHALELLKGSGRALADQFSIAMYNVMMLHYNSGRMAEWEAVDTLFRASVAAVAAAGNYRYAITTYAMDKLKQKEYALSRQLALYDYYTVVNKKSKDVWDKLGLMYDDWMITKGDVEQWLAMPYDARFPEEYQKQSSALTFYSDSDTSQYSYLRSQNFIKIFKTLFSRVKELTKEMVVENEYTKAASNAQLRRAYYDIYIDLLNTFYSWSVSEHKEAAAILAFREFLYQDLVPNEMEAAKKAGARPVVRATEYISVVQNLANLYHRIGNGQEEEETAMRGVEWITDEKLFTRKEGDDGLLVFFKTRIGANRLQRNYEASLKYNQGLKLFTPRPDSVVKEHPERWDDYMQVRIEEVYTLLASKRFEEARDSLSVLLDNIAPLDDKTDFAQIYKTRSWPHLQYLVALIQAQQGKWMTGLLHESVSDLERQNVIPEIYYPVQLFNLKAVFREEKKVPESLLSNLLFYTGRQLRYNFVLLSAGERMQFFEQELSPYFDVYHELLFSGYLDAHPALKEKVIAQSISLKNALADGNLIPDRFFDKGNNNLNYIEKVRLLRQDILLLQQKSRLRGVYDGETRVLRDQVQNIWLTLLEEAHMDSLTRLTDWRTIQSHLKPGQVYTEVIRFSRWLTDSAAYYGAYVVTPSGKMEVLTICPETMLAALLKDPSASPQTIALNGRGSRGVIQTSQGTRSSKTFQKGALDQVGLLLLKPLWPFINTAKEWLVAQDGLLNRISFAALQWNNRYLFEYVQLKQVSGSYSLFQPEMLYPSKGNVLLAGGLNYGKPTGAINHNRLFKSTFQWNYLPGTLKEVQGLQALFAGAGNTTTVLTGNAFPDSLLNILKQYQVIHLATHGFYLDSAAATAIYEQKWDKEAVRYEPLYRCGIALSNANDPGGTTINHEGYLLGYELANVDLRNCYLVSLSACETGLGDLRNNLGVDGLSRALKLSGARHLLISLWKVPDQATAVFMELFYKNLLSGKTPVQALRATQAVMSKTYTVTDWAAFILMQ